MNGDDLERLAAEVRGRARLGVDEVLLAPLIAVRVLGPRAIARVPALSTGAALARVNGDYRIVIRARLPDANFAIAHELGHWALRELARYVGPDEERLANYLGAAILAPPQLTRQAYATFGEHYAAIARAFRLSQTSTVLRLAEVHGDERAVVTRTGNVLLRTRGHFAWDLERVRSGATSALPGLVRARLQGGIDTGRVALRVA